MKTLEVLERVLKGKRLEPNAQKHYRGALGSLAWHSEDWPVSGEEVDAVGVDVVVGDMFPEIPDGTVVRTLLKCEDRLSMRKIFIWYASHNRSGNDAVRAREVMKRMLRKRGSERYAKRK